jgi:hypothetical protein
MAVSINPKSEARFSEALIQGFAELPSVTTEDGETCWALPGNIIVCDREQAMKEASKLDMLIRNNVRKTGRVLH